MGREKLISLAREYGLLVLLGVVGIGILVYGLWQVVVPESPKVEIIKSAPESSEQSIYVDVAGAVEKPGVYQLPSGGRVGDALVAAGGLSAEADRGWVSQTLNLAEAVKDGEKIYIPENSENSESRNTGLSENQSGKININTAGQSELETLNGIGEARAKAIVGSRPYKSTEELVSKAKIPQSVYDKIKDQISIF